MTNRAEAALPREPVRHKASERNRRKALHHAKCLLEELQFIHADHVKRIANLQYSIGRASRLVNRLAADEEEEP